MQLRKENLLGLTDSEGESVIITEKSMAAGRKADMALEQ